MSSVRLLGRAAVVKSAVDEAGCSYIWVLLSLDAAVCGCDCERLWLGAAVTRYLVRLRLGAAVTRCGCEQERLPLCVAVTVCGCD